MNIQEYNLFGFWGFGLGLLFFLVIWTLAWKGIALWKAGRNNQLIWFIAILILNTAGILPILYLAFFQKKIARKR